MHWSSLVLVDRTFTFAGPGHEIKMFICLCRVLECPKESGVIFGTEKGFNLHCRNNLCYSLVS